jgi:hypothetical protein
MIGFLKFFGERAGIRTLDLLIKSQLLYRLSYALPWAGKTAPEIAAEHRETGVAGQPEKHRAGRSFQGGLRTMPAGSICTRFLAMPRSPLGTNVLFIRCGDTTLTRIT